MTKRDKAIAQMLRETFESGVELDDLQIRAIAFGYNVPAAKVREILENLQDAK